MLLQEMDMGRGMEDDELLYLIHSVLNQAGGETYIPLHEKIKLSRELFHAFRKLDILQDLIEDDDIT